MSKNRKEINNCIKMSQNFLTSRFKINNCITKTNLSRNDIVLEIGPGKGHITDILLNKCSLVYAVELDFNLYNQLQNKFKNKNNLKLYHHDFLNWQLPNIDKYKVFSNIPFNSTTEIVDKLTKGKYSPEEMWLIMEKGASKRFIGSSKESLKSLEIKPFFEMDIAYYFQKDDFHPKPKVDIVLVHFKKKDVTDIKEVDKNNYFNFIKTVRTYGFEKVFTKNQLSRACMIAGLKRDIALNHIKYAHWISLYESYKYFNAK
ncbi:MAG: 23S ribosomal RNA methyltransferase Erm [Epulopiscium sp.]|nr:23S ribosomal RNA methyltransferase Erm [Candidatus Epulonipiscium sp.]